MPDQSKQPGLVVAVLALLGVFSLPQVLKLQDGSSATSQPDKVASAATDDGQADDGEIEDGVRELKPLIDYLSHGKLRPTKTRELKEFFAKALERTTVRCLVVTLPNPVESVASSRFDEYLDVVQRAVELQQYVLDRSLLPWKKAADGTSASPDQVTKIKDAKWALDVTLETKPQPKTATPPGLMIFRRAFPQAGAEPKEPSLLLAFLVPESPITGVHKREFVQSLDLIDTYFRPPSVQKAGDRSVLHIIAPCFNSSERSLELALKSWEPAQKHGYHFRFISSAAGQIDKNRFEKTFAPNSLHELTFHSMVHHVTDLRDAMIEYLTVVEHHPPKKIAVLIESNTGLAQAFVQRQRADAPHKVAHDAGNPPDSAQAPADSPVEFLFPLQVAEVRKSYARGNLLRDGKIDDPAAPERLRIPPDEGGVPRDLPRSFTPSTSAALDEMALTQLLTTIARHSYEVVCIIATDPFDVVFLAREVHRFCPNARLFTTSADLLVARPAEAQDLRGMLVASTYPLYPSNQWITTPFQDGPRVFFSDRSAQGFYNATVAHLWEMGADEPGSTGKPAIPQLLEFGLPYDIYPKDVQTPPVWISAVGQRGLYPITYFPTGMLPDESAGTSRYLYTPTTSKESRRATRWPPDQQAATEAKAAMRPRPHLLFWLLLLTLIFACIVVGIITLLYIWWSTDPKKHDFRLLGFISLEHLLRRLNCEVAPRDLSDRAVDPTSKAVLTGDYDPQTRFKDPAKGEYVPRAGAGIYVFAMNLLTLCASAYVFWPFLIGMHDSITLPASGPNILGGISVPALVYWLTFAAGGFVATTTVLALAEFVLRSLLDQSPGIGSRQGSQSKRAFVRRYYQRGVIALLFVLTVVAVAITARNRLDQILRMKDVPQWRLSFERLADLPSGVSPIFPALFLATSLAALIYSQVARRRLYRVSFLRSDPSGHQKDAKDTHFEAILKDMRAIRGKVDRLIATAQIDLPNENPLILSAVVLLYVHIVFRFYFRDLPSSLEGMRFNWCFWPAFLAVFTAIVWRTLKLRALWRTIRKMLQFAVDLPLSRAYDRIPARFKGWFFGEEGFDVRKQIILQQSIALGNRTSHDLARVFSKVFGEKQSRWEEQLVALQKKLKENDGTLDSTRAIYPLLTHIWCSLPVEQVPRLSHAEGDENDKSADWLKYWPLMPSQGQKLDENERAILRDWVRMAEDLIALQIVRWFAPALSQLLPMMQFLVIGSISLLLAVTSYPFGHQGWLMTLMVGLIVVVAAVVASVLIGVNRDELISRVSDRTPGRLNLDSNFVGSILTTFAPLVGALLAISFDVSDLLHAWFGPLFQLF